MAAARFPAKTPARTAPLKAHHLPVSEARRGRGRGGVSSPDWWTRMLLVQKRAGTTSKTLKKIIEISTNTNVLDNFLFVENVG